jgi:DNA repair protein SbcD/Mre11
MQFTFVHAADLHIDSPLDALGCKDAVVAERFARAGRRAVEALVTETIASKAAFLLISGDIFDGDWRDVTTGLFFVRELGRLEREGIATFIVRGNHDFDHPMAKKLPYPASVRVFAAGKAQTLELPQQRVALHGRSFNARLVGPEFLHSYPARREGWLNIGLLHTALDGARGHESYAPCSVEDLKRFGYDYWALGHVHAAEEVSRDPYIVYPGNIQGRSVRETGPKGAMRVTVEDGRVARVERMTLDAARWGHALVDLAACADELQAFARIEGALAAEHAGAEGRPLALRLTLTGATPLHARLAARRAAIEADLRAIAFRFSEDFWIESVKLATRAPAQRLQSAASDDTDALDVEALIARAAADPEYAQALAELAGQIAAKAPAELREALPQDESALTQLAREARDRLWGEMAEAVDG